MMRIDNREPDRLINKDWGFETTPEQLDVGDYIFSDKLGVERKEINDFVGSLNGRLWEQLANMEDNFDISVLVVTGTIADLSAHNMEPRKIQGIYGALARITVSYDISVFWFREESAFIKLLKKLEDKLDSDSSRQKPHLDKRNFRDDRINILYGIYGVGHQTAKNLLEDFDSIAQIANAPKSELAKTDGIGPKSAKKIYQIMHDGEGEGLLE